MIAQKYGQWGEEREHIRGAEGRGGGVWGVGGVGPWAVGTPPWSQEPRAQRAEGAPGSWGKHLQRAPEPEAEDGKMEDGRWKMSRDQGGGNRVVLVQNSRLSRIFLKIRQTCFWKNLGVLPQNPPKTAV